MFTRKLLQSLQSSLQTKIFTRASSCNAGLSSICNKIKAVGPITVADYMKECLLHPIWGYYATQDDIIGSKGDFITSPEISQVFGELIGVWVLADVLVQNGKGSKCRIVELGPGKGTLANDIIKVFHQLKDQCSSLEIHLVEASSKMANLQYTTLTGKTTNDFPTNAILDDGTTITWYTHLSQVPKEESYYIAHEFFDALPVHQFRLTDAGWRELLVDIESTKDNKLRFIQSAVPTPASVSYTKFLLNNSTEGEISPETLTNIEELIERIRNTNGAALIADYGDININKLTLRGFRNHKETDVLLQPGLCDMTADVNFDIIKTLVNSKGVGCHGPITQNKFLHNMGIKERFNALVNANDTVTDNLLRSYEMLTSPKIMGERFKFLSITSRHRHVPTPF